MLDVVPPNVELHIQVYLCEKINHVILVYSGPFY